MAPPAKTAKTSLQPSPAAPAAAGADAGTQAGELPETYEAALQELEGLVGRLESGQLPLDQLLNGYQRGAQLLQFCRSRLDAVQTQIKVLEGTELKPWLQA